MKSIINLNGAELDALKVVNMLDALERMQEALRGVAGRRVMTDMEWRMMAQCVKEIETGIKAVGRQVKRAQDNAEWIDGVLM